MIAPEKNTAAERALFDAADAGATANITTAPGAGTNVEITWQAS